MTKTIVFIVLIVSAVVVIALGTPPTWDGVRQRLQANHADLPQITTADLASRMQGDLLLLDVRSSEEWQVSHLPGAIRVDTLEDAQQAITAAGPKAIVCYCAVGIRSAALAGDLIASGQGQVSNLQGGIFTWAAEDRPLIDDHGQATDAVHPYNWYWGQLAPGAD